ncbi:MAG: restriction endonuclease subunit S [Hydrogenibacillus schlegelii]|uniref:Restriction endonuclease subunit S n=1 Tax=Hydrogenibacillus schlegelii TaxID=1484 RepID=A0A947CU61_HYDSH|nr:restriction endonuclease subunit S [Hydrogenibacillus schlegelii]
MASEWRQTVLVEVAHIASGKRPPVVAERPTVGCAIPVFGGGGVMGFTSAALYEEPVLITGRVGTLGILHLASGPSWPSDNTLVITAKQQEVDQAFLYYVLLAKIGQVVRLNRGSSNPLVTQRDIGLLTVPVPSLSEQRAIAHILGTLDDKIELNRRMSETLEAMARAIFKAWFVDFEPVRAKMEGRWRRGESLPGLPAHLYDLFPDRLVDSELGEIPEGWEVAKLGDLAEIRGGVQLPAGEFRSTGIFPVYGANGIMGYSNHATHNGFVIAFGRVGASCGSVHWTYSGAWINNNATSVVPKQWPEFVLQTMLEADFENMQTGSAQPFIPNSSLAALRHVRAHDKIMDEFCRIVRTMRLKEQALHHESRTLAALRDALLPKLISGELRIKDAEQFLKERGL